MSIILSGISYRYYNQQPLFESVNLSVGTGRKVSVTGNNGTGKSTLLKLIAGELECYSGSVAHSSQPYYIPQQIGITGITVSHALAVTDKLEALYAIGYGSDRQIHYDRLADDWDIESRCRSALAHWNLSHIKLTASIDSLSGGEKTKLFLAGIMIHRPAVILLDEPTNHLDTSGRQKLYDLICGSKATIIVVSHDRTLLNLLEATYELSAKGLKLYGGNYDFYRQQKEIEKNALEQQINTEQAAMLLARRKAREVRERQEKRAAHGKKNKGQIPRIMLGGRKNNSEKTTSRLQKEHAEIIAGSHRKLNELYRKQDVVCDLKIDFEDTRLHYGKRLVSAKGINFKYDNNTELWEHPVNLEICSGERLHIFGDNGTGKTTLVRLVTGELLPATGEIIRSDFSYICLDQEYSKINTTKTVLELAHEYNRHHLLDHDIKLRLHRALFPQDMWNKKCNILNGGEKMRLYLCCLMIFDHVPDLFILDEPTNNLDLSSLSILTDTIKNYRGTLLVISHDRKFIDEIGITACIGLKRTESPLQT
ncbi:MAG: ABC-F family ATP-binding cassette domain-containing protein [Bacteroidales bacterium]|nr:ABC-F family ATP-binding cassette domain-containing protein [Bacteroidales bacterium]